MSRPVKATRRAIKPRKHISLALRPDQVEGLERIMAWAEQDPHFRALATREVGLQTAVLYAVAHTLRHPPEHINGRGGER